MSNTLTYILDLHENLSPKLKTINGYNDQQLATWAKVQRSVVNAASTMNNMGRSIGSLQQRINALNMQKEWIPTSNRAAIRATNLEVKSLEREITKLNNLNGGKLKKWLGDIKNSIPGFVNPLSAAILGIGKVIKTGMNAELQKTNLRTLFKGNEQAATEMYDKISGYSLKTPYEKTDLIEGQKLMMSFGISANKSFDTLGKIGDIAMGDSQKMQSLTLAFSQATSAGKLQGQDLLQMINAGFNPLQVISERTGESMEALKDRMSKGKISAEELAQAFTWATDEQGLFYKGAEKASLTLHGKLSNLTESLSDIAIGLYDKVISPILSPLVDLISKVFTKLKNGFNWLTDQFSKGNVILYVTAGLISAITLAYIAFNTWQKITATWTQIITFFKYGEAAAWWAATAPMLATIGIIAAIIAVIAAVVASIIYAVKHTEGWGTTWQNITTYMGLAIELFKSKIALQWMLIKNDFITGFEVIEKGWYKLQSLWDKDAANAGLAKIQDQRDKRASEIAAAAGKTQAIREQMSKMKVWEVKTDGASFIDFISGAANKVKTGHGINGGIASPTVPGADFSPGSGDGAGAASAVTNNVTAGGTRNTDINIHIGNMVENINFDGGTAENAQDIEQRFTELLLRALNMAYATA